MPQRIRPTLKATGEQTNRKWDRSQIDPPVRSTLVLQARLGSLLVAVPAGRPIGPSGLGQREKLCVTSVWCFGESSMGQGAGSRSLPHRECRIDASSGLCFTTVVNRLIGARFAVMGAGIPVGICVALSGLVTVPPRTAVLTGIVCGSCLGLGAAVAAAGVFSLAQGIGKSAGVLVGLTLWYGIVFFGALALTDAAGGWGFEPHDARLFALDGSAIVLYGLYSLWLL